MAIHHEQIYKSRRRRGNKKQAEKKFYVFLSPPVMNDIFDCNDYA